MNSSDKQIKQILLEDDIFPLGKYETIPVSCVRDGSAESYPYVALLQRNVNYEELLVESLTHMGYVGFNYVKPRLGSLNPNITENELREVLEHVGFYKGSYQSFSLRQVGTNELERWVLPKTREFFNNLAVNTFRQQYAVAYPGWNVRLHRDHANFNTHGFRAMVPLSADVFMAYEDELGNNLVFRLKRGGMYFVNIAKMHRGFNESTETERINLIFQMDSDKLILNSERLQPIGKDELSKLPSYAVNYETWKFGHEL